jgi:hypothetical protein
LQDNARAEEMIRLLGQYEEVRLARKVPDAVRERLQKGEWRMEMRDGELVFRPVSYDTVLLDGHGEVPLRNRFEAQPLAFRLRARPRLAAPGDAANRVLFRPSAPLALETPASGAFVAGGLANRVEFAKAVGDQPDSELVGPESRPAKGRLRGRAPDLTTHRALAVRLEVDGPEPREGELCPVLNVQFESSNLRFRDHHIDLDFRGSKTVVLPGPTPDRTLPELWPARETYFYRHAMIAFDHSRVVALNFRWMRTCKTGSLGVRVHVVEALRESEASLRNPEITIGGATMRLPVELRRDDYAEFSGTGEVRVFDANGKQRSNPVKPAGAIPVLHPGVNRVELRADELCPVKLTVITTGQPPRP